MNFYYLKAGEMSTAPPILPNSLKRELELGYDLVCEALDLRPVERMAIGKNEDTHPQLHIFGATSEKSKTRRLRRAGRLDERFRACRPA